MRKALVDASNPRTTSLNLLGIERGRIAQVSLNVITRMSNDEPLLMDRMSEEDPIMERLRHEGLNNLHDNIER